MEGREVMGGRGWKDGGDELTAVGAKAFWRVIDSSSQVTHASLTKVDLKSATACRVQK